MKTYLPKLILGTILLGLLLATIPEVQAQCPMCKGVAQTSQQAGDDASNGLNAGIMYLFLMPYVLVGVIGYLWYRKNRQAKGTRR